MKVKYILICLTFLFIQQMQSQESTKVILDKAYDQAKIENKNVFVIFHASWCGWCKKMDANMNDVLCKNMFDQNYVIEHLVVQERKDKKNLENLEAFELLKKYKGENSGIPFFLIFDKEGKLLADSFDEKGQNLGCPATEEEVAMFTKMLKETSTLSDKELVVIAEVFQKK